MAGDWIKLQKDTFDKPEVLAIATRMDIDPDAVVGKLCRIWAWFDTHTTHGNASCVTFSFVDRYVGVTGFAEQVALVGWLAQDGHDLRLPNFDYHNGETSKTRALGKNRAEKARSNARSNAPCVTKSLPEKRREEKSSNTPIPPKGADADSIPEKQKTPAIALPTWLEAIKASSEKPIPETDPVFAYAEQVGIPPDHLRLCWREFRDRYSQPGAKRYRDWRGVFRKAVRGNWFKLWWVDAEGQYLLTTCGKQAEMAAKQ